MTLGLTYQELKFQYGKLQCDEIVKTPWAVHYRDSIDVMPVTDMEFAFPINLSEPTKAVEAIHAVVEITKEYAINGNCILTCMALLLSKVSSEIIHVYVVCITMHLILGYFYHRILPIPPPSGFGQYSCTGVCLTHKPPSYSDHEV